MLENLKSWTTDDTIRLSGDDHYWKHESGDRRSSDSEMLKTYSTGLLAVCLARYDLRPIPFVGYISHFLLQIYSFFALLMVVVVK